LVLRWRAKPSFRPSLAARSGSGTAQDATSCLMNSSCALAALVGVAVSSPAALLTARWLGLVALVVGHHLLCVTVRDRFDGECQVPARPSDTCRRARWHWHWHSS